MTALEALFLVLALLQVIAAAGWGLSAWLLGLSRSAGLHWAASAGFVLLSVGLALHLTSARMFWSPALDLTLINTCILLSFAAMRRGAAVFLHQPRHDLEQGVLVLLMLCIGALHMGGLLVNTVRGGLTALLLAWVAGRLGATSVAKLRAEFGAASALVLTVPMFSVAVLFAVRALRLLLGLVPPGGELITAPTSGNIGLMLALFLLSALLNLSLGYMVILRLIRRLHHVSRHDALTGLLNRRAMQELMDAEYQRLLRGGEGFALLLIDVDHFKSVNDRFGHAVGDQALRAVSGCLQATMRKTDVLARFGGEEFSVLLRMTGVDGALESAERLNDAVRAAPLVVGGLMLPVTVSIGVAVTRPAAGGHALTIEKLLVGADRALYRAKAGGRDRLAMATEAEMNESGFAPMIG